MYKLRRSVNLTPQSRRNKNANQGPTRFQATLKMALVILIL